ncbi:MAG: 2-keto-3-deoxygluconate permease, partial [Oscillospiraceae bacterium]
WAVSTTAGNAVLVPASVALIDPSLTQAAATATPQVAAAVVVTAIVAPIMTNFWAKKYGSPQFPQKANV